MTPKQEAIKLITAVAEHDYKTMLEYFPEGVECRSWKYKTLEDFQDWETYEDYARYVAPAREVMTDKVLQRVLELLEQ
jgi:hypothetical protein